MPQRQRTGRLDPAVGAARQAFSHALTDHLPGLTIAPTGRNRQQAPEQELPLVLVACSGGPDSLALAAVAAHFRRRGDLRAGAVVVDHGLQPGSAEVASEAARACQELGLDPVIVVEAEIPGGEHGPEMGARLARYEAFERVAAEYSPAALLLGHTLNDQAETVLLGLSRGSGTRSLAGMPVARRLGRTLLLRPFLGVERDTVHAVCSAEGLSPWQDPSNQDSSLLRNRVRHEVLPFLEQSIGPGIEQALSRTAAVLTEDAAYLEAQADRAAREVRVNSAEYQQPRHHAPAERAEGSVHRVRIPQPSGQETTAALSLQVLRAQHPALRRRVLARYVVQAGGESPSFERLTALEELVAGHGNAGPIQMAGRVAVWRRRPLKGSRADAGSAPGALVITRG